MGRSVLISPVNIAATVDISAPIMYGMYPKGRDLRGFMAKDLRKERGRSGQIWREAEIK